MMGMGFFSRIAPARIILILATLIVFIAPGALAQAPSAEQAAPSEEQVRSLIATLENEEARAALVENLRLLIEADPASAEDAPPAEAFGARALDYLSDRLGTLGALVAALGGAADDLPELADRFQAEMADPGARGRWIAVLVNTVLALGGGLGALWALRLVLRRPRESISRREGAGIVSRLLLLLVRLIIDLLPLSGLVLAAYIVLGATDPGRTVRLVVLAIVNATLFIGIGAATAKALLSPNAPNLRLFRLQDETAAYLFIWIRRTLIVGVYGYVIAEAAVTLGLPLSARTALLNVTALLVALMMIVFVLQNRKDFADALRGAGEGGGGALGVLRRRLADIWHLLAIAYIVGILAIWFLDIEGGFLFVVRATALTAVILIAARLLTFGIERGVARGFAVGPEFRDRFPGLEARANRYLPIVTRALKVAVIVLATLGILQVWGLGGFAWLATDLGRSTASAIVSIAIVLAISVVLWEIVSNIIERRLSATDENGEPLLQNPRTRTLLPLLRNAFMVVLIVIVGLIVLSEIGVNIAPLLAGAGVIGLAIGFGSQALVKDVITGLFILFEDTISVGDVVDLGGHSGVVEAMSIRTIRLRDLSGQVHAIPFGEVLTVQNMTKDFGYYVLDIRVGYREDIDQVIEAVIQLGKEFLEDPAYAPFALGELEILGVDGLGESAAILKARIKAKPGKQWMLGREFNRRMMKRFAELGIEVPYPPMRLYFGEDKKGDAPPVRVALTSPATVGDGEDPAKAPG
ncbi:mechanosensitive ion channel domain-containing protein [Inquilinus sp. CAU 1745]|uniref:mechanosensitive ion channel domain-containing protein n=1 Tax=Inquilinus sp. CAU 1745 TaxID=3140369 RepID=UPI00325AB06F